MKTVEDGRNEENFISEHSFGEILRGLRNQEGLTQFELASSIEVSRQTIINWENGKGCPKDGSVLEKIDRALCLTPQDLDRLKAAYSYSKDFFLVPSQAPVSTSGTPEDRQEALQSLYFPPPVEHFIGRVEEIDQVIADLQPGRVISLRGPSGVGKSAIANEVVQQLKTHELHQRFADGVIWHEFYAEPHTNVVIDKIIRHCKAEPKPTPRSAAQSLLAQKRLLLVLDGAEQADYLDAILNIRGQAGVLITSIRHQDTLSGKEYAITPFALEEAITLLQAWAGPLAEDNAVAGEICRYVENMAYAVRLAGSQMACRQLGATQFLHNLQKSPLPSLDIQARKKASATVLLQQNVSHVGQEAQAVFGVAGTLSLAYFSSEVIAAALDVATDAADWYLGELVHYGLLDQIGGRYAITHRLAYAYAQSYHSPASEVIRRLADYYTVFSREQGNRGQAGFARLDQERSHIVAILARCKQQNEWEAIRGLVTAIKTYFDLQGYWQSQLISILELGKEAAEKLNDRQFEGKCLGNLGNTFHNLGQVEQAIVYHQQALTIAREINDRRGEGANLGNLGLAYSTLGQVTKAIPYSEQALQIAREINDRRGEGASLANLGSAYYSLGQVPRAIAFFEQALEIARQIGDWRDEGALLSNLGVAYRALGQVVRAIEYYQQALEIAREIGDRRDEGNALGNLGSAYYSLEQVGRAIEYYQQALEIAREIGDRWNEGAWLGNLGSAYYSLGEMAQAIEHYQQALEIAREIGDRRSEGTNLGNLGITLHAMDQLVKAIECYGQALTIAREIGDRRSEGSHLSNLGLAYRALGQGDQAKKYLLQSKTILDHLQSTQANPVQLWLEQLDEDNSSGH